MRRKNTTSEMMKGYISESLILLLKNKEYSKISIGEIADKAGVNRSTYYRNFGSKEDIIRFYYWRIINEYVEQFSKKTNMTLKLYLVGMFEAFLSYKKGLILLHKHKLSYLLLDELNSNILNNTIIIDMKKQLPIFFHMGGIFNSMRLWFQEEMLTSPEDLASISVSILPDNFMPMLI